MINKKIATEVGLGIILLVAIAMGGSVWLQNRNAVTNNRESVTNEQQQQQQQAGSFVEEIKTIPDNSPASFFQNYHSINTRYGYDKSLKLIPNNEELKITNILLQNENDEQVKKYRNKLAYVFESKSRSVTTLYDLTTNDVFIFEDNSGNNEWVSESRHEIPDDLIDFGIENAMVALEKDDEFMDLKNKNANLFQNYSINVTPDDDGKLRWGFVAHELNDGQRARLIAFFVDHKSGGVKLIRRSGF